MSCDPLTEKQKEEIARFQQEKLAEIEQLECLACKMGFVCKRHEQLDK